MLRLAVTVLVPLLGIALAWWLWEERSNEQFAFGRMKAVTTNVPCKMLGYLACTW